MKNEVAIRLACGLLFVWALTGCGSDETETVVPTGAGGSAGTGASAGTGGASAGSGGMAGAGGNAGAAGNGGTGGEAGAGGSAGGGGRAVYCDLDATSDGDGSYASPLNSIASVNSYPFESGDDVYFKAGTSEILPAGTYLDVDWSGTAANPVYVGAYSGEGRFGLDGEERPVLDGNHVAPTAAVYFGMVRVGHQTEDGPGYVYVRDLALHNSGGYGFTAWGNDHGGLSNCYIYRPYRSGINVVWSNDYAITDNVLIEPKFLASGTGASLEITGPDGSTAPGRQSHTISILRNYIYKGNEGYGSYKGVNDTLMMGNVAVDTGSIAYYMDGSGGAIVDNLAYWSSGVTPRTGFGTNHESMRPYCYGSPAGDGHLLMLGNTIANAASGTYIANQEYQVCSTTPNDPDCDEPNCNQEYLRVAHNTVVHPTVVGYRLWELNPASKAKFYNNQSVLYGGGGAEFASSTAGIVEWDTNGFAFPVGGDPSLHPGNAIIGDPLLVRNDWSSIAVDGVLRSDFALTSASPGKDRARPLTTVSATVNTATVDMPVTDPAWLFRDLYFAVDGNADGDMNDSMDFIDRVVSVDLPSGIVTLANAHTFLNGGEIHRAVSMTVAWYGDGPDVGAMEFVQ